MSWQQPTTPSPSRLKRASPKPRPSPNSRPKSSVVSPSPPDANCNKGVRRSLGLSKQQQSPPLASASGSQKARQAQEESKAAAAAAKRRLHRPMAGDPTCKKIEDEPKMKTNLEEEEELHHKLELSQRFIHNLESEMLSLKAELDRARGLNLELRSQNQKLTLDLAAAEAKIQALTNPDLRESIREQQAPKFKDIQKLIANKLNRSVVKTDAPSNVANNIQRPSFSMPPPPPPPPPLPPADTNSKGVNLSNKKDQVLPSPPPPLPPPPPPPPRSSARATSANKSPTLVQLYHSLTKQEGNKDSAASLNHHHKLAAVSAHNSIVGEIQNRSSHLLAIKSDIETKGEFINGLIEKVLAAAYPDIEDVVKFVDWLDGQLSSLADERAVLKHFKWPERKADAMREAAIEYRELKLLEKEISSFKDDSNIPCAAALKKMGSLLDRSERSIQRLIKLRNSVLRSYQECRIPTEWMLDSGIVSKIKQASMKLAKVYMKRVTSELESIQNSDRECSQESLLLQGVKFAYRAHQFAGGLDSETLCAFEEIRQRFPGQVGGSRELLAGIPSS